MQRGDDPRVSDPVIEPLPLATPVAAFVGRRESDASRDVELIVAAGYDEFAHRIRGFAITAMRDSEAADDVVQEAFLRLVVELRAGRRPENLGGWLYRVAANLIISRGRRRKVADRFRHLISPRPDHQPSPEDVMLTRERDRTLALALSRLPADARVALLLAARGMGAPEIGVVIHRTPAATRTYLCRSRVRLRDELAVLGVEARE
jgi:RNA polymerase sigma-70 factor, ECF subfamily